MAEQMSIGRKLSLYIGLLFLFLGLVLNKWFLEALVVQDGQISSTRIQLLVGLGQLGLISLGLLLLFTRPRFRWPGRAELLLVGASTVFALILAEIGVRTWLRCVTTPAENGEYYLFSELEASDLRISPHPYLSYYLTPGFRSGLTSHNSLGYRGAEFSVEKPEGVFRIVVLGGSTTYTQKVEDDARTFPAQLERVLVDRGYLSIEVINAGVPGYSSWESLINLAFRVLDVSPDLAIVYHGTNDVHARFVEPSYYRGDNIGRRSHWTPPSEPWWEHSALLRAIARRTGLKGGPGLGSLTDGPASWYYGEDPVQVLRQNKPIYFQRNLENMIAIARAHDVRIMLATWAFSPCFSDYASTPHYQLGFRETNDVIRSVAASRNTPIYDFASEMPTDTVYWVDGRHLNAKGAFLKAELFASFLERRGLLPRVQAGSEKDAGRSPVSASGQRASGGKEASGEGAGCS